MIYLLQRIKCQCRVLSTSCSFSWALSPCPSLMLLLSLPHVFKPFLLLVSLSHLSLLRVFYFCFMYQLGCIFLFLLSFSPGEDSDLCQSWSSGNQWIFIVMKNKPEMIALWSGSCKCHAVGPGGFWGIWVHPHLASTAGSGALSEQWLVTLAAVDQRGRICAVSDCTLLVLGSMEFSFSHLLCR